MTRHRSRLGRLGRTAETVPPTAAELTEADLRARARALALLRRAAGDDLTDAELEILDDRDQAAADLDTHRRHLRAEGIDPDVDDAAARARLLKRAVTDPYHAPPTGRISR